MTLQGQVGLVSDRGWAAKIIQWVTRSVHNHVVVALDDEWCVSAEPDGALHRPITYFAGATIVWSRFEYTGEQTEDVTAWAREHIGFPYSRVDFIAAAIGSLLRERTPTWVANLTAHGRQLVCSQFADHALRAAGIQFVKARYLGAVTPADFGRVFLERGWADRP